MSVYSTPGAGVQVTLIAATEPNVRRMEPWLTRAAKLRPEREALEGLTYAELHERASRADLGDVGPGDRVALALPPGEDFVVAFHALLLRGATAVPLDLRHTPEERAARSRGVVGTIDAPLTTWKNGLRD